MIDGSILGDDAGQFDANSGAPIERVLRRSTGLADGFDLDQAHDM